MGRPPDEEKHDAFVKVATFLEENDDEQITVSDLIEKMEEYLRGTNCGAYRRQRVHETKLRQHFGDKIIIIITDINVTPNVNDVDIEEQKMSTMNKQLAKLIKNDIKSIATSIKGQLPP